jgi:hypothetical protein
MSVLVSFIIQSFEYTLHSMSTNPSILNFRAFRNMKKSDTFENKHNDIMSIAFSATKVR